MDKLESALRNLENSDMYPFHMPGHKRKPVTEQLKSTYAWDITEIDGFDNLHHAEGILKEEQEFAADLFGVALNILGTDFRKNEDFPKRFAKHRQDGRRIRTMMKAASAIQIMPFFTPFRQWDIRPGILAFRLFHVRFFLGVGFTLGFPIKKFLDGLALLVASKR